MSEDISPYWITAKVANSGSKVPSLTETSNDEAKRLVDEHWEYIERLLSVHGETTCTIGKIEFHYKSSGIHFWKHALEWVEDQGLLKEKLERNS